MSFSILDIISSCSSFFWMHGFVWSAYLLECFWIKSWNQNQSKYPGWSAQTQAIQGTNQNSKQILATATNYWRENKTRESKSHAERVLVLLEIIAWSKTKAVRHSIIKNCFIAQLTFLAGDSLKRAQQSWKVVIVLNLTLVPILVLVWRSIRMTLGRLYSLCPHLPHLPFYSTLFQHISLIHSHFSVLTARKPTRLQTRAFKVVCRPVSLGDWAHLMTPSCASSGVATKGHVT